MVENYFNWFRLKKFSGNKLLPTATSMRLTLPLVYKHKPGQNRWSNWFSHKQQAAQDCNCRVRGSSYGEPPRPPRLTARGRLPNHSSYVGVAEGAAICRVRPQREESLAERGPQKLVWVPYEWLPGRLGSPVQAEIKPDLPGSSHYEIENGRQIWKFKHL